MNESLAVATTVTNRYFVKYTPIIPPFSLNHVNKNNSEQTPLLSEHTPPDLTEADDM